MGNEYILEMKGISKSFSSVKVLHEVDFRIKKGEVHALMGENGAGKSTLIKILTGIYSRDGGTILFDGKEIHPADALEAQKAGISTIYQEISLIGQLSVAENIYIGREIKRHGAIDWKAINEKSRELLAGLGLDIDVTKVLSSYGTAIQQMVAIARSILIDAKLVIMDVKYSIVLMVYGVYRVREKRRIGTSYTNRKKNVYDVTWKRIRKILKSGIGSGSFFIP